MSSAPRASLPTRRLDRASWFLWGVTFVLLLAFAATVPALYVPLLELAGRADDVTLRPDSWITTVAVIGLVALFCLYTILQQRQLIRMRRALEEQEREREDVGVRLSEISTLFQVSTTLQLQLRPDVILEIIVRRVVSTLRAQQASIMILDPETHELVTRASYGLEAEFSRGARAKFGEGIAGWVAERREAVKLGPTAPTPELARWYKENRTITSALSLPLLIGDRVVGVLNVNRIHHPEMFEDHHLDTLRVFGEHVAEIGRAHV